MSEKPKVLIVESSRYYQACYCQWLGEKVVLFQAEDLTSARQLFDENSDIALVVVGFFVAGRAPDPTSLVRYIRERGFIGPMIVASDDYSSRQCLMEAGCDCEETRGKEWVPNLVAKILGFQLG